MQSSVILTLNTIILNTISTSYEHHSVLTSTGLALAMLLTASLGFGANIQTAQLASTEAM